METLCNGADENAGPEDLTLCSICLQWTCDGPECHRDDVCDEPASSATSQSASAGA